jgi:formate/nitrite transporter FocA (FNT family)
MAGHTATPTRGHLAASEVVPAMKRRAGVYLGLGPMQILILAVASGNFVPIFLAVSLFVAGSLQRSPANMGYFSLSMATGGGPVWADAFLWNVIPAGIGNILGGSLLVALPFWVAFRRPVTQTSVL